MRYEDRTREDAEMWCDRCHRRHGVNWIATSDIWNAVMRDGSRANPDEIGFCCPSCFMELADERGIGNRRWVIAPEPDDGPFPTLAVLYAKGAARG